MTPLYDVLSAWPMIGSGPNQFQLRDSEAHPGRDGPQPPLQAGRDPGAALAGARTSRGWCAGSWPVAHRHAGRVRRCGAGAPLRGECRPAFHRGDGYHQRWSASAGGHVPARCARRLTGLSYRRRGLLAAIPALRSRVHGRHLRFVCPQRQGARRAARRGHRGAGLVGLVGSGDRRGPAVRRPDRGRAEGRQGRAGGLDAVLGGVTLGPRRGSRGGRPWHAGAGALRRRPVADGRARDPHDRHGRLGGERQRSAVPGAAAGAEHDDRATRWARRVRHSARAPRRLPRASGSACCRSST